MVRQAHAHGRTARQEWQDAMAGLPAIPKAKAPASNQANQFQPTAKPTNSQRNYKEPGSSGVTESM